MNEREKYLVDAREFLEELDRIYEDHYKNCYDKTVHDIFNAVRKRIKRYSRYHVLETTNGPIIYLNKRLVRIIPQRKE
jgi:diphthamide biosynthesis methyltransferase